MSGARPPEPEYRDDGDQFRMQTVRVTAPDLARRAALEKTRGRLLIATAGFTLLFLALTVKLTLATIIIPLQPHRADHGPRLPDAVTLASDPGAMPEPEHEPSSQTRATITDRNGQILAMSLPTASVYANPKEMIDPNDVAAKLKSVLPSLDLAVLRARLSSEKQFVWITRGITPAQQIALNNLGIPGIYFQATGKRRYPQGRVAAQVLGGVDVDGKGVAGVERFFDQRLREDPEPLRLSLDVRVQGALRDELSKSMDEFHAIGACGIVMDVRTGEVIAMVSLPDYDANQFGTATPEQRFNRAVTGMYEPGSTFKLQTAAMTLDSGVGHLWSTYDASHDIKIGRFTISDFQGKHRVLTLPEVIAYSSNLGAAHMAQAMGADRQRSWLQQMGMFTRVGIELPEQGQPIVQPASNWKDVVTMTVGFGHGIAISPLHVVRGTAAVANGGIVLRPTILAPEPDAAPRTGTRAMQQLTSDTMRKLMRLVVTDGYGKPADVPGYFVGGKTGTAEKNSGHGYKKHSNISAFMSVFPMNDPRYAVYFMLDEPKGNASTGGYSTAGAVSAPGAGRVIARIAPMLGMMPQIDNEQAIQATLAMPLVVPRPVGWHDAPVKPAAPNPTPTVKLPAPPPSDPRQREAAYVFPDAAD
jgi:cell division protein FtsI (penicillin-binding protein 3)